MENEEVVKKFMMILGYVEFQVESSCGEILSGEITKEDIDYLKDVVMCVVREH